MSAAAYNVHNPAVKRILREVKDFQDHENCDYFAAPLEDNIFEWHFTVRGPVDTEFEGGVYHGRIILPPEYPMKPPNIVLLTPNGRFEVGTKICLSVSAHHPEEWKPSWGIRTILIALVGFMPTPGSGAIGALDLPPEERKKLALQSSSWKCSRCGVVSLPSPSEAPPASSLASSFEQSPFISSTESSVANVPIASLDSSSDSVSHPSSQTPLIDSLESEQKQKGSEIPSHDEGKAMEKEEEDADDDDVSSDFSLQNSSNPTVFPSNSLSYETSQTSSVYTEGLHHRHVHPTLPPSPPSPPSLLPPPLHPHSHSSPLSPSPVRRHQKTVGLLDLLMVVIVFAIIAILVKKYVTMNH